MTRRWQKPVSTPQLPLLPRRHATTDTSASARTAIQPSMGALRQLVLQALHTPAMTADEVADYLKIDRLAIRPRVAELYAMGVIVDSGDRRPNASGKLAIVWAEP